MCSSSDKPMAGIQGKRSCPIASHNNIRAGRQHKRERGRVGGSVDFSFTSSFVDSRNGAPSSRSGRSRREIDQELGTAAGILSGGSSSW
ncbi:hypothetical protein MUK42_06255 [Musa troglodytarum]|uniref:Uncharacterized protein n=1 Tax=Musa troglodytarum TaxID=320322 RepID=A0A9E7HNC5_9LILI|nr:hypothetical protein MUK42_06255 [Musa troglodytarum]